MIYNDERKGGRAALGMLNGTFRVFTSDYQLFFFYHPGLFTLIFDRKPRDEALTLTTCGNQHSNLYSDC